MALTHFMVTICCRHTHTPPSYLSEGFYKENMFFCGWLTVMCIGGCWGVPCVWSVFGRVSLTESFPSKFCWWFVCVLQRVGCVIVESFPVHLSNVWSEKSWLSYFQSKFNVHCIAVQNFLYFSCYL